MRRGRGNKPKKSGENETDSQTRSKVLQKKSKIIQKNDQEGRKFFEVL